MYLFVLGHLSAKLIVKAAVLDADQVGLQGRFTDSDHVTLIHFIVRSAIHGQKEHFFTLADIFDFKHGSIREDHGTSRQGVRADGCNTKA